MATIKQLNRLEKRLLVDSKEFKNSLKYERLPRNIKLIEDRVEWVIIRLTDTYDLLKLARKKIYLIDKEKSEYEKIRFIYRNIKSNLPYSEILIKKESDESLYLKISLLGLHLLNTEDFTKIITYLKNRIDNYLETKIKLKTQIPLKNDEKFLFFRSIQKDILYNDLQKNKIQKYFKLLKNKYENQSWQREKRPSNINQNKQIFEYKKIGKGVLLG